MGTSGREHRGLTLVANNEVSAGSNLSFEAVILGGSEESDWPFDGFDLAIVGTRRSCNKSADKSENGRMAVPRGVGVGVGGSVVAVSALQDLRKKLIGDGGGDKDACMKANSDGRSCQASHSLKA